MDLTRGKRYGKCLRAIIELMEPDYSLGITREKAVEILKMRGLRTSVSSCYRYEQLIKSLVDFLQKTPEEQRKIKEKHQLARKNSYESQSLLVAIEAFEKDGIISWAKVQDLLYPTPTSEPEKTAGESPEQKSGKGWFRLESLDPETKKPEPAQEDQAGQDQVLPSENAEFDEAEDAIVASLVKLRNTNVVLRKTNRDLEQKNASLSTGIDNLETLLQEMLQEMQTDLQHFREETPENLVWGLKDVIAGLESIQIKFISDWIEQQNAALKEQKAMWTEQKAVLAEQKAAWVEQQEMSAKNNKMLVEIKKLLLTMAARKEARKFPPQKPNGDRAEPPTYSQKYKRKMTYNNQAREYIKTVKINVADQIVKSFQLLADYGREYPSLDSKKIVGGVHDGKNQITCSRKYRALWIEKPDCIYVDLIFKKGEKLDNIKV
jgi:hypothetical protein